MSNALFIAGIVQARMASSRLPGKVMRQINGKTILRLTLERLQRIPALDVIVCAISDEPGCEVLVEEAKDVGVHVFVGSEIDVLARHMGALDSVNADAMVRITSDCPLTDVEPINQVIECFKHTGADLVTNNDRHTWVHGLDAEIVSATALLTAFKEATKRYDREHVTPFIKFRRERFDVRAVECSSEEYARLRWTLDTPQDWAFFKKLYSSFGSEIETASWRSIAEFCVTHSDMLGLEETQR